MCTVVYLPTSDGIRMASLRDESPLRKRATPPALTETYPHSFLSPEDALAGGTWVGVNEIANVIILMNGGFSNHVRKPAYRRSRGLIVSDLLSTELPVIEWNIMNMEDIEPYTLIVYTEGNLFRLTWDGQRKHRQMLDKTKPHMWSSATLYNAQAHYQRQQHFDQVIAQQYPETMEQLFVLFHSLQGAENGFLINRNEVVKTLSYSFIEVKPFVEACFSYFDLGSNTTSVHHIPLAQQEPNQCTVEW